MHLHHLLQHETQDSAELQLKLVTVLIRKWMWSCSCSKAQLSGGVSQRTRSHGSAVASLNFHHIFFFLVWETIWLSSSPLMSSYHVHSFNCPRNTAIWWSFTSTSLLESRQTHDLPENENTAISYILWARINRPALWRFNYYLQQEKIIFLYHIFCLLMRQKGLKGDQGHLQRIINSV